MNCEEVQAELSDYVDLSIGAARLMLVEEHLAACAPCRDEAELLGESIRELAALPLLETPLGFAQRVMSHVRDEETQPSFWQRFLLPLSGKIPAQTTALVIVGFMGIYLLQKEAPHQQLVPTPEATTADAIQRERAIQRESASVTTFQPSTAQTPAVPRPDNSLAQERPQISASSQLQSTPRKESRRRSENPVTPPMGSSPTRSLSAPPSTEPTLRPTPIVSSTPVVVGPAQAGSAGPGFSAQPDSDGAGLRAAPATIEPFADRELIVRRHTNPPAESRGDGVDALQAEASPANVRPIERLMAAIPDRTRSQTIWINVPENQYEQFKKELHTLGIIESETRVPLLRDQAASYSDGQIRVKLTAVPAGEAATTNPATGR